MLRTAAWLVFCLGFLPMVQADEPEAKMLKQLSAKDSTAALKSIRENKEYVVATGGCRVAQAEVARFDSLEKAMEKVRSITDRTAWIVVGDVSNAYGPLQYAAHHPKAKTYLLTSSLRCGTTRVHGEIASPAYGLSESANLKGAVLLFDLTASKEPLSAESR